MGCWNETCGISNLHIRAYSDKIVVFPLIETGLGANERVYAHCVWSPIAAPFEASYDDYGGAEDANEAQFGLLNEFLKTVVLPMPLGANQYHDIAINPAEMNLELFNEGVHESRLTANNPYLAYSKPENALQPKVLISRMMVRKDILDSMLKAIPLQAFVSGEGKFVKIEWKEFAKNLRQYCEILVGHMSEDDFWSISRNFRVSGHSEGVNKVGIVLERASSSQGMSSAYRAFFNRQMTQVIKTKSVDDLYNLFYGIGLTYFVGGILESVRKMWQPNQGAGSQAQDHEGYEALIAAMKAAIKKEKQDD